MNILTLMIFSAVLAGTPLTQVPAVLPFVPNRPYTAKYPVMSVIVPCTRFFIDDWATLVNGYSGFGCSTMDSGTVSGSLQQES